MNVNDTDPPPLNRPGRRIGIREIAGALGVSIGTVDRALHHRAGINPITRDKVLKMAETLGYRPNLAARYLASRRQIRVAVNLPLHLESFFDQVRTGIRDAAEPFSNSGIHVVFRTHPRLGEGEAELLEEALTDKIDGMIIAPGSPERLKPLIRKASQRKIPVVCVATDAPGTPRLTSISVDPYVNGAIVAELMGRFISGSAEVLVVTGLLSTVDHQQKINGFCETTVRLAPHLTVAQVVEAHDDENEAYCKCAEAFKAHPAISGVYVSTANSPPVLRLLDDLGLAGRVTVISTDLFPALATAITEGKVAATIHQRPWSQGRLAFETLHRFLTHGICPSAQTRLAPHVIMRSNLGLFTGHLASEDAGVIYGGR